MMTFDLEIWQIVLGMAGFVVSLFVAASMWNRFMFRSGSWKSRVDMRLDSGQEAHDEIKARMDKVIEKIDGYIGESREHRKEVTGSLHKIDNRLVAAETKMENIEREVFNGDGKPKRKARPKK